MPNPTAIELILEKQQDDKFLHFLRNFIDRVPEARYDVSVIDIGIEWRKEKAR